MQESAGTSRCQARHHVHPPEELLAAGALPVPTSVGFAVRNVLGVTSRPEADGCSTAMRLARSSITQSHENAEPAAWSGRGMARPVCIFTQLVPRHSGR